MPHFSTCLKCTKKSISKDIKGWAYVSDCRNNYRYHVACVKDMFSENLNNLQLQPTDGRNKSIFSLLVHKGGLIGKTVSEDSLKFIISMVQVIISLIIGVGDPMSIILTFAGALPKLVCFLEIIHDTIYQSTCVIDMLNYQRIISSQLISSS